MSSRKERLRSREGRENKNPAGPSSAVLSPHLSSKDVTASLKEIYGEPADAPEEELSAALERARRRGKFTVLAALAAVLFLLAGAAWLGFWLWDSRSFSGRGLELSVEGPSRVALGQEAAYFINWSNRTRDPLASLEIRANFPNDFALASVEPKPASQSEAGGLVFRLGAQTAEARGTIKIAGTFTGALGSKTALQVIGTYRPASFNGESEELVTRELEYADTVLEGEVTVPSKVLPGDKVTVAYTLRNKGQSAMSDVRVRFFLPEGFVRAASSSTADTDVAADGRTVTLPLGILEAGASTTARLIGSFALGARGEAAFQVEAGRLTSEGVFAAAERSESSVSVLAGDLNVKLVMNGSDKDRFARFGENQRIAISYENTSGEELRDVTLRFHLGGDPPVSPLPKATSSIDLVDWRKLDDPTGGAREYDTLTYGKDQIAEFERMSRDAQGVIELTVPLVEHATTSRDVPISAWVEAVIGSVDKVKVNRAVKTQPVVLRLQTDASLSSLARYASEEGAPLGRGPLPPRVGTSTVYRIEWRIAKTLHELERVSVIASLPKNISFGGVKEVGAGEVAYDPDARRVSWTLNKMPANVSDLMVSFDVSLVPSLSDAGRFADLLGESRLEFTDAAIASPLLVTSPALTSDLPEDELAKGKGVVRK